MDSLSGKLYKFAFLTTISKINLMRKLLFMAGLSFFVMTACKNSNTPEAVAEEITEETPTSIGGEKDEHGCLIAAGESWSQLKEDCIQIFNEGKRLNPIETNEVESDPVFSAFVVFNEDESKAELFLPNEEKSVLLEKAEESLFKNDVYSFNSENATLSIDGEEKYVGN